MKDKTAWWHSLSEECPITLELLSTLPYPPFSLTSSGTITSYFDGLALASYIVSRGIFQNPLTREELSIVDCRRLDDYLESYCYNQLCTTSRKISVAEAFALRESIHVDQVNRNQSRARILQSTATAALAGLFVYGNDRRRSSREEELPNTTTTPTLPREDQLILDWGFDLRRTVEDTGTEFSEGGYTIIDDDEAMVVATEREAYQATQNAFPRLGQRSDDRTSCVSASTNAVVSIMDEHIVERVRELSVQDEMERHRRERQRELARQKLLQEALMRREERQCRRHQQRAEEASRWEKVRQEQEEIQRARVEIEQWRDEQWKKLRVLSEAQAKKIGRNERVVNDEGVRSRQDATEEGKEESAAAQTLPTPEELEEQKKVKAAEKRKRAKQRKKAQRAEERATQEMHVQQKELQAKKAASASKCDACGQGMLDSGFEKYGKRFCSTACARTAQPPRK